MDVDFLHMYQTRRKLPMKYRVKRNLLPAKRRGTRAGQSQPDFFNPASWMDLCCQSGEETARNLGAVSVLTRVFLITAALSFVSAAQLSTARSGHDMTSGFACGVGIRRGEISSPSMKCWGSSSSLVLSFPMMLLSADVYLQQTP